MSLSSEIQLPEATDQRAEVLDFLESKGILKLDLPEEKEEREAILRFLERHGAKVTTPRDSSNRKQGVSGDHQSFSEKWSGSFALADKKGDPRFDRLTEKYIR